MTEPEKMSEIGGLQGLGGQSLEHVLELTVQRVALVLEGGRADGQQVAYEAAVAHHLLVSLAAHQRFYYLGHVVLQAQSVLGVRVLQLFMVYLMA